jgi:hypothetical protein
MTPSIAMLTGLGVGFALGVGLAAFVLMELKPHPYVLLARLPARLHKRLRAAARVHGVSISTEIERRLERSLEARHEKPVTTTEQGNIARWRPR